MIVDALITFLVSLIDPLIASLPMWSSADMLQAGYIAGDPIIDPMSGNSVNPNPLVYVLQIAAKMNAFVPVDQLILLIGVLGTMTVVVLAIKIFRWIAGMIRGAGTGG